MLQRYTWVILDAPNASGEAVEASDPGHRIVSSNHIRALKPTLFANSCPTTMLRNWNTSASNGWVDSALDWGILDAEYGPNYGQLDHERLRPLLKLVERFRDEGYPCNMDGGVSKISPETAEAASQLLRLVPQNSALPKIAPDGECGLVMAWEAFDSLLLLTIDGWTLHVVADAATPSARYYDDIPFDGHTVPSEIREELRFA